MRPRFFQALLLVLVALDVSAICTPSVSATVANDLLTIEASVAGGCGSSGVSLFVDGSHVGGKNCTGLPSCSHTLTFSTYCMSTGSHIVTATADCMYVRANPDGTTSCIPDTDGSATASFTVQTKPSVSFSYDGPDAG